MRGYLILKDGSIFEGELLGSEKEVEGEVVFNTGMVGYEKSLTDPSYFGQILVFTYPLIGNYGIGEELAPYTTCPPHSQPVVLRGCYTGFESDKIQVRAVVVSEICNEPSHQMSKEKLEKWCSKFEIPILAGIDTRYLTERIRNYGTLMGGIFFSKKKKVDFKDINKENLVSCVSLKEKKIYENQGFKKTVLLYDCGVKFSIIKNLLERKIRIIRVPFDFDFQSLKEKFDGVVISNGPGDPQKVGILIEKIKSLIGSPTLHSFSDGAQNIPILGICLGNQILSLALGAKTYKLKFGHRSANQPVQDLRTKKCYITSQNHGFAVDKKTLPSNTNAWFENLNDGTCEGIYHTKYPLLGVQFHPEANPGPMDTNWIFDLFLEKIMELTH